MVRKLCFSVGSLLIGSLVVSAWLIGTGMAASPPKPTQGQVPPVGELHLLDVDDGLGPEWENAGIYGATAGNAAYDPTTEDVYLATAGAYYKSTDGGQTWNRIASDGNQALAVDQVDGTVYLGLAGRKEIWVSANHGITWSVQSIVGAPQIFALDPSNRNVAFFGTGEPFSGGAGRVYRSLDRGVTWNPTFVDDGHCISSVAVNPLDENNVWAVSWGCQGLLDHSAVFSSTDRGLSYSLVLTDSNPFEYSQILFDSNGLIYLAGDAVRISANGGITFTAPALDGKVGSSYNSMVINPVSNRVHITTNESGYHCDNGGPWVFDGLPGLLVIDPNAPTNMLASAGQGVRRSTDGGVTWHDANIGLEQVIVAEIAGNAQDASTVYATTHQGSGRSLDGGDTWEYPNTETSSRGLAVSPITSAIAYMGQDRSARVYSTTNAGDSWFQTRITDTEGFVRQIAVDPVSPNIVYATVSSLAYDPYADTTKDGLYVSTNNGATWEDAGLLGKQINSVALGSDQTDVIVYAGEGDIFQGQTTGGLWRLDPSSSNWVYKGPVNTIITRIAVDPRDPLHVYAGSCSDFNFSIVSGLFESHDGGDTWNWIYPNAYVNMLEIDPQDPDIVYFSDGAGLYRTLDGGETWEEYDRHPDGSFNTLYFNYSGIPTVFAGTGEGIFRRRLGAKTQAQQAVSSTLQFTTTRGTTITIEIPAAAVSETVDLLFTDIPNLTNLESNLEFAGHAFNLNAFRNNEKIPSYSFQSSVTVTIAYTDTDVTDLDENLLRLLYLDGDQWVDAACGPFLRDPGENWIQVPICHLGQFGLFEPSLRVYLPLIVRESAEE